MSWPIPNDGKPYTKAEKKILDWVTTKISDPKEMGIIAPTIAEVLGRSEGAIRKQIEDRKQEAGDKDFFWART